MIDITKKTTTLRVAVAVANLKMKDATIAVVTENTGPKPDILATSRAAAFLAVKNTPAVLPHCHPSPIESVKVDFEFLPGTIQIKVEVKTLYKTGCEMEALHGVSIAALTVYDMLKPVDKDIEITGMYLEKKSGGKSDYPSLAPEGLKVSLIVSSDSVAKGKKEDKAGKTVLGLLQKWGVQNAAYSVVPDEPELILNAVQTAYNEKADLILTCGGTGLGPRDVTTDTLRSWIEREIPGMMEAARDYGQERTPFAMLSRGIAGLKGKTLLITLPGSTSGAKETMEALFPAAFHIFKVLDLGYRHEEMATKLSGDA